MHGQDPGSNQGQGRQDLSVLNALADLGRPKAWKDACVIGVTRLKKRL
jgi:hypothetical protein